MMFLHYKKFSAAVICLLVFFSMSVSTIAQDINIAIECFNRGLEAANVGNMPSAVQAWNKALKIFQTDQLINVTKRDQAACYRNVGVALIMNFE